MIRRALVDAATHFAQAGAIASQAGCRCTGRPSHGRCCRCVHRGARRYAGTRAVAGRESAVACRRVGKPPTQRSPSAPGCVTASTLRDADDWMAIIAESGPTRVSGARPLPAHARIRQPCRWRALTRWRCPMASITCAATCTDRKARRRCLRGGPWRLRSKIVFAKAAADGDDNLARHATRAQRDERQAGAVREFNREPDRAALHAAIRREARARLDPAR